jgi:hypothetical protein
MAIITLACVLAMTAGVCGGAAAGVVSIGPVETVALVTTILFVIAAIVVLNMLAWKFFPDSREHRRWRRIIGRATLAIITLSVAILSVPLGITLDSLVWLRSKGASSYVVLRPLDPHCFTHGFVTIGGWNGPQGFRASDLLKLRRFDDITVFHLHGGDIDDATVDLLCAWRGIVFLEMTETRVTDGGIQRLAALRWLRGLNMSGTRVKGETFGQLPPFLINLWLEDTAVNDESLKPLAKLAGLSFLQLSNTDVGDAGVANLAGAAALSTLNLSGTKVTDAALASLGRSNPSIGTLVLQRTRITAAGLTHLRKLPKLQSLDLGGCVMDDEAVAAMVNCRSLKSISLFGTNVTAAGAAQLSEALPDCTVELK